ncbi:Putative, 10TM heavy-metal exporter [Haladaptatus litoreus]|uniref:Putative, 10TM heavy-metal exporter n=1 Tax=Haladaptatus litoreus TaxID=553468 RepID=A0A1N6Y1A2_9EURY|nr:putative manganese transporter [Haladaptatus litoreus]SIR08271.1 Putative, 10TM heavy-metal exporter [Haladaptatus litoreus]
MNELLEVFLASVRDGYVQVSAFVAVTVLLFGLVQYRTSGALVERLSENERLQPFFGALMGLTPGCGGAIVMMPLYVRGTVSFGTVVATLIATAGDSAFVILALAPEAGLYAYGIAFGAAIVSGYAIDKFGMGVGRIDSAVANISNTATDGGVVSASRGGNPTHEYDAACETSAARESSVLTPLSHAVHALWWVSAGIALVVGVMYLTAGAPEVPLELGLTYAGVFTVVGVTGTTASFYIYFVGRHYLGDGHVGRARDTFANVHETLVHAAQETSFVTVWVLTAYLLYEYSVLLFNINVAELAAAAGLLAPVAGAALGLIPGCGPQIVLASVYAEGGIPFSALTANAISQDGDALFPLIAIDKKAAIVASIYTTIPALIVGIGLHVFFDFGSATGFGVL